MRFLVIPLSLVVLLMSSCSTVTISNRENYKTSTEPNFERSYPFFMWGLAGEKEVNVADICQGKSPKQMQTQMTFIDGLLTGITLGIYAPRTVKVWCEN